MRYTPGRLMTYKQTELVLTLPIQLKVPHPLTHEGRGIYRYEGDAKISYSGFIEVKETYLTDTPALSESTGKNSR